MERQAGRILAQPINQYNGPDEAKPNVGPHPVPVPQHRGADPPEGHAGAIAGQGSYRAMADRHQCQALDYRSRRPNDAVEMLAPDKVAA